MVEIEDIVDGDSLKAWLLQQPEEVVRLFSFAIGYRVSQRLIPDIWYRTATRELVDLEGDLEDYSMLPILRLNLSMASFVKAVPSTTPNYLFRAASDCYVDSLYASDIGADFSAANTITAASQDFFFSMPSQMKGEKITVRSIPNAYVAYASNLTDEFRLWREIRSDCRELLDHKTIKNRPLWQDNADPFADTWAEVKTTLGPDARDWQFWIDWYESMLHGRPQNADMLHDIALIDDAVWKQGLAAVNAAIADIQAKYLSKNAPLAERMEFDRDTAKFYTTPIAVQKPPLMSVLLSRVEDSLGDCLHANGLTQESNEVRVIRRTLTSYRDDPQRIEMDFTDCVVSLRGEIEKQWLQDTAANKTLIRSLEECVRGVRELHPEVAENRMIFAVAELRALPEADKQVLAESKDLLVAISQGATSEDFATDIPELVNDALIPVPDSAPRLPPAVRVFGRVSRMQMMIRKSSEIVNRIVESTGFKAAGILLTIAGIVQLGLSVFGVF